MRLTVGLEKLATEGSSGVSCLAEYSLWLLPEFSVAQDLDGVVASLAPLFACPVFQAHMTVQGDLQLPVSLLQELLPKLAAQTGIMTFVVGGLQVSAEYFRSFFLEFEELPAFRQLQAQAAAIAGTDVGLSPFPHVSLAYGEPVDPHTKRHLLEEAGWQAMLRRVRFDRLALVRSSRHVPIAQWSLVQIAILR